jgi:phosphatidylserine/phosphatidylglycerophosphate/cardiolipin synthase-like enzyme
VHLSKSPWIRWGAPFVVGLLLVFVVGGLRASSSLKPLVSPLPQDPYIQVYFNQNQASVYRDPYRHITRYGDNLEQVITDAIAEATSSLDIAVHELNLPLVAQAISDRAAAGVAVRIIVENTYRQPWSDYSSSGLAALDDHSQAKYDDFIALADQDHDGRISAEERSQSDAIAILEAAQIPIIDDTADGSKGSGLMHHKFMVVDGRKVITGSTNWTLSGVHGDVLEPDSRGNANALVVLDSAPLADSFEEEFAVMWGDGPDNQPDSQFGLQKPYRPARSLSSIPGSTVTFQFSPTSHTHSWETSVNGLIAKTLQQAQQRIDLALFVFSDQNLSNELARTASRGVAIDAVIDPGFAYRSYSEALDMLGTAIPNNQCKFEPQNQPWQTPILAVGVPTLPPGDKLHHKFAVIDDTTVIIGSQNWSQAANETNDENLLVIQNPTVAAHFRRESDRLQAEAELGMTPRLQGIIQKKRQACGL